MSGFCELLQAFVSNGYRRNTVERTENLLCGETTDWFMDPGEAPFWGLPEGMEDSLRSQRTSRVWDPAIENVWVCIDILIPFKVWKDDGFLREMGL